MNSISAVILFLSVSNAFAHPTDDMPYTHLGTGTILTIKKDINFPPYMRFRNFTNGEVGAGALRDEAPYCNLHAQEASTKDRSLRMNTTMITAGRIGLDTLPNGHVVRNALILDSPGMLAIECFRAYGGKPYPMATIGDLRTAFGPYVEIAFQTEDIQSSKSN